MRIANNYCASGKIDDKYLIRKSQNIPRLIPLDLFIKKTRFTMFDATCNS